MRKFLTLSVVALVAILGCKKNYTPSTTNKTAALSQQAKAYFEQMLQAPVVNNSTTHNGRTTMGKTLRWNEAYLIPMAGGQGLMVPVSYEHDIIFKSDFAGGIQFHSNDLTKMLFYQDASQKWHGDLYSYRPDSNYLKTASSRYSGVTAVEDWWGNSVATYWVKPDGAIYRYNPAQNAASRPAISGINTTCFTTIGQNSYLLNDSLYTYTWYENTTCTYQFIPEPPMGGGLADSPTSPGGYGEGGNSDGTEDSGYTPPPVPINVPVVNAPKNKIGNYFDYIKCFTSSSAADHKYKVTLAIEQPKPGTRQPWSFDGDSHAYISVGHVFLIFDETYGSTHIVRNVGFYPDGMALPVQLYSTTQGTLGNDQGTPYNVATTFTVTNDQFFAMLNYASLGNNPGFSYDLSMMNCTTFAIATLHAGDVNVPSTIGYWGVASWAGHGNNPGDLGEDIRANYVTTGLFSGQFTNLHPNVGNCY